MESVTPNERLDLDTGPNNLQNYPRLFPITSREEGMIIGGTIESSANTDLDS